MNDRLRRLAAAVLRPVIRLIERGSYRLRQLLGLLPPLRLVGYRGFGTREALWVRGRVVAQEITGRDEGPLLVRTALRTLRRILRAEVPEARVRLRWGDREKVVHTDADGHFDARMELPTPLDADEGWQEVEALLLDASTEGGPRGICRIRIPPADAERAIVTDVDDTLLRTRVASPLAIFDHVVLHTPAQREPIPGAPALVRALAAGNGGKAASPVFYLSGESWLVYEHLRDALDANDFPEGPLILREMSPGELIATQRIEYKTRRLRTLLQSYPELSFVLVGDVGRDDPRVYARVAGEHPGRVRAVFLYASEGLHPDADEAADTAMRAFQGTGTDPVIYSHPHAAAREAVAQGLIPAWALDRIPPAAGPDDVSAEKDG